MIITVYYILFCFKNVVEIISIQMHNRINVKIAENTQKLQHTTQ